MDGEGWGWLTGGANLVVYLRFICANEISCCAALCIITCNPSWRGSFFPLLSSTVKEGLMWPSLRGK